MSHHGQMPYANSGRSSEAGSFYAQLLDPPAYSSVRPKTSTPIVDRSRLKRNDLPTSMSHHNLIGYNRNTDANPVGGGGAVGICRSDELRNRIHEHYLSYLSREETSINATKQQIYEKLEKLITEYLYLVPNSHKFSFKELHGCFCDTAGGQHFDPRKVVDAFEAIEHYIVNLINFPWRAEYRKINAFGGFFVHTIDNVLHNYRPVLELIGYMFNEEEQVYSLSEMPIDPDRLFQVALECLVAIVECKIMHAIYVEASSAGEKVTWPDVHSVRVDYVCNVKNAVKLLADLKKTGKLIDLDAPDYSVKRFHHRLDGNQPSQQPWMHRTAANRAAVAPEARTNSFPVSNTSTYF